MKPDECREGVPCQSMCKTRCKPRRKWQGLTDEELFAAYLSAPPALDRHLDGFRAIEAALKEKNA